jgi:hypothetical protein
VARRQRYDLRAMGDQEGIRQVTVEKNASVKR